MEYGDLVYKTTTLKLTCGPNTQQLSRRESMLMEYFMQNPDQTISRQMLYSRVWGPDGEVEDGNLDTYIYYLRKILNKLKSRVRNHQPDPDCHFSDRLDIPEPSVSGSAGKPVPELSAGTLQ